MNTNTRPRAASSEPQDPAARSRFAPLRSLIFDERRRHRVLLACSLFALVVVACLTVLARLYTVLPVDVWFTTELQENEWELVSQIMYAVSIVGYAPWSAIMVGVASTLVALILGWRDGLYLMLVTVAQGLVNIAIKAAIGRPRPLDTAVEVFVPEHGFSFPSGHVMFYTVFFGFLLFLVLTRPMRVALRWLLGAPLAALILLVGPSRIILGSHWLSDVLAAYLLGLVLLVLAIEGRLHLARRS
jgi:undecaprenyl-diphosphatase